MNNLIAYYRVSSKRQGRSGLGLEAQQADVAVYARQHGGKLLASYTEVETGKRSDRPELARAIAHAKRARATLVVAKLDRLARNVAFTSKLMDSGVDFVCCDNPHATRLTIHILAAVAEDEARRISERTKAGPESRQTTWHEARRFESEVPQPHQSRSQARGQGRWSRGKGASRRGLRGHARVLHRNASCVLVPADRRCVEPERRTYSPWQTLD